METLVRNTNRAGPYRSRIGPLPRRIPYWRDVVVTELYTYFAILIYIALHIENKIAYYWVESKGKSPKHEPVQKAMARDRFKQIHTAFHISEKGKNVFEMV